MKSSTRRRLVAVRPDFDDHKYPRGLRVRLTSPFPSMTESMVATVVVATGRCRRSSAHTSPSSQGPASQSSLRISSSPSVGCVLFGRAMNDPPDSGLQSCVSMITNSKEIEQSVKADCAEIELLSICKAPFSGKHVHYLMPTPIGILDRPHYNERSPGC